MFRGNRPDYAFYAKRAGGSAAVARPTRGAVAGGYRDRRRQPLLHAELAVVAARADRLARRRARFHARPPRPDTLRLGDTIDYWTVIGIEPARRLTLNFGMKAPGNGVLEFEIEPRPAAAARIGVTAYWHPQGVWGLLYWYALVPAHGFLFKWLTRAIARRAEALQARAPAAP